LFETSKILFFSRADCRHSSGTVIDMGSCVGIWFSKASNSEHPRSFQILKLFAEALGARLKWVVVSPSDVRGYSVSRSSKKTNKTIGKCWSEKQTETATKMIQKIGRYVMCLSDTRNSCNPFKDIGFNHIIIAWAFWILRIVGGGLASIRACLDASCHQCPP
jgi:hypothetical protein